MIKTPEDWLAEYRNSLLALEQKSQESYDKTVLALSTGAFGITFAFVDQFTDFQNVAQTWLLIGAWISWSSSAAAILFSYYFSQIAIRLAIRQVDEQRIFVQRPGGWYNIATAVLNASGGLAFLIGLGLIIKFVSLNLRG